ncbi:MAG: nucleotide pyrophosphohydrolase, partial [Candidatus Omnitrophica bacterium]|nr:nucleotide pyrophosphohydrolase [Candidatus Omnitrophota bacterium]
EAIIKELGDVLWYVANLAKAYDLPLSEVAESNIDKLQSRADRGKIQGEGDNR